MGLDLNASPYAIAETEPPNYWPGEELAAAGFVGITFYLFVDVNVSLVRVFRKKTGLYYFSLLLGTWGCFFDNFGVILKYLCRRETRVVWGLYTFLLLGGWATYAPMQLWVLYSRLHLLNDNRKVQKVIQVMIISTYFTFILPTWVVAWPAYSRNKAMSAEWSPRDAIVERYTQMGYTLCECVVSGVYIWSLLGILHHKSSVRQRRVMYDLIYVNLLAVGFDVVVVILFYLNRIGLSHPIQTFSYMLKFKLEFVVLNQLMAVAARGMRKQTYEEKRYHNLTATDTFSAEARRWDDRPTTKSKKAIPGYCDGLDEALLDDEHAGLSPPPPAHQQAEPRPQRSTAEIHTSKEIDASHEEYTMGPQDVVEGVEDDAAESPDTISPTPDSSELSNKMIPDGVNPSPRHTFSGETLSQDEGGPRRHSPHLFPRSSIEGSNQGKTKSAFHSLTHPFEYRHQRAQEDQYRQQQQRQREQRERRQQPQPERHHNSSIAGHQGGGPIAATLRRHRPYKQRSDERDEDEEEIGVHMWERKNGQLVLEAPWFASQMNKGEV